MSFCALYVSFTFKCQLFYKVCFVVLLVRFVLRLDFPKIGIHAIEHVIETCNEKTNKVDQTRPLMHPKMATLNKSALLKNMAKHVISLSVIKTMF